MNALPATAAAFALIAGPLAAESPARPAPPAVALDVLQGHGVESFRAAIAACWASGALSPEALASRVTLAARFDAEGRPEPASLTLLSGQGAATDELYHSARRALLRCGAAGLPLPDALRATGRRAELTFDPQGAPLR